MVKRTFAKRDSMPKTAIPSAMIGQRPFQSTLHRSLQTEEQADLQTQLAIAQRTRLDWSQMTVGGTPSVQAKLKVGAPGDQYEQEADRVADQVMSMPDSAIQQPVQREANPEEDEVQTKPIAASITQLVQREAMPEEEEVQTKANTLQREEMPEEEDIQTKAIAGTLQREEMPEEEEVQTKSLGSIQREEMPEGEEVQTKPLQRSPDGSLQAGGSIENRLNSSKGGGSPLPNDVRSFMEPRFGTDFSQVRVHTGSEAVQMNRDLNAQAFAHKQDIYFGAGKTPGNNALTAHELTHVVQQAGAIQRVPQIQREGPDPAQDLNQQYEAAKNSGDWGRAAELLNGFSREDILARLGWNSAQLDAIHKGASNNPAVGPESQVARLAKVRYLDVNFKAAMKAGSWKTAAEFLNGFNSSDIIARLAKLKPEDRTQLKRGAMDGGYPEVTKEILEEPAPADKQAANTDTPPSKTVRNILYEEVVINPGGMSAVINTEEDTEEKFETPWEKNSLDSALGQALIGVVVSKLVAIARLGLSDMIQAAIAAGIDVAANMVDLTVEEHVKGISIKAHNWYGRYLVNKLTGNIVALEYRERSPSFTTTLSPIHFQQRLVTGKGKVIYTAPPHKIAYAGVKRGEVLSERSFGSFD